MLLPSNLADLIESVHRLDTDTDYENYDPVIELVDEKRALTQKRAEIVSMGRLLLWGEKETPSPFDQPRAWLAYRNALRKSFGDKHQG